MCASRPRRVFSSSPSADEKENAQSDEAQGAAEFVEEIAEVKPGNADAEGDYAEVDESAARCSYSPPNEEDAEAGDQSVSEEFGSVRV